ncbi:MAG: hypothetical protein Q9169_007933 [Polycauliona sp. 2 TL-2023]
MTSPPPSGFAIRRNGTCPSNQVSCGATTAPFYACCPSGSSCPSRQQREHNIACCPSPTNCLDALLQEPRCANDRWTLYDNNGYFCCAPGTIGYNASRTASDGCAAPGSPPRGAQLLAVVSAGQTASDPGPTSDPISSPGASPEGSSSNNTGAIVGGVVGGVAAIVIVAILVFYFLRGKRKNKALRNSINPPTAQQDPEKNGTEGIHEKVETGVFPAAEVDSEAVHELPTTIRRQEPVELQ